jgi:hypothetical protein
MSTRKAIKGDEAMVSALYEWMDEIEQDHGCPVRVVLHGTLEELRTFMQTPNEGGA